MRTENCSSVKAERFIVNQAAAFFTHAALHSPAECETGEDFCRALASAMLLPAKTAEEVAAKRVALMKILPCEEESWAIAQAFDVLLGLCIVAVGRSTMDGSPDLLYAERQMSNFVNAVFTAVNGDEPSWWRDREKQSAPHDWFTGERLA